MKAPHEEMWTTDGEDVLTGPASDCEWSSKIRHVSWGEGDCEARARLAAAAPEMARMLLYIRDRDDTYCPCCHILHGFEHEPACELIALLKKVGAC